MIKPEEEARIKAHLAALSEDFTDIVLLCSRVVDADADTTERYFTGAGSHYARQGMTNAWLQQQENANLAQTIAQILKD